MNKTKSLLTFVLCVFLAFFAVACGKAQPEGNVESGNGGNESVENSSNSSDQEAGFGLTPAGSKDVSLQIYLVGTDKIGVIVKADECVNVAPKSGSESGTHNIYVDMNGGYIQFGNMYGNIGFDDGTGNYTSYNLDSYSGGMIIAGTNMVYAEVNADGICNSAKFDGDFHMRCVDQTGGSTSDDTILEGNLSNVVKKVSEDEYAKLLAEELNNLQCVSPAQADWSGFYFSDNYSDAVGYLEGRVLDGGLVYLTGEVDDNRVELYGIEENYDKAEYDYDSYTNACVYNTFVGDDRIADVSLYKDDRSGNIGYSERSVNGGSQYKSVSLYQIVTDKHNAPKDYEDKDIFGLIDKKDVGDAQYFKAESDDYVITVSSPNSMYYGSGSGESVPCISYEMAGFDINGMMCESIHKYVFENEADAKKVYDYLNERSYSEANISGNVVYEKYDDTSNYPKISYVGYDWYGDCHYIYDPSNINGEYQNCKYLSKPLDASLYEVPMDTLLFFKKFPQGTHRSFETPDASLYVYLDSDNREMYVSDYRQDKDRMLGGGYGNTLRMDGLTATSIAYVNGYNVDISDYEYYVVVTEFEYGEDGVANVTEHRFKTSEHYKDVEVTLDNYKSKNPDKTVTLTFDMNHVE